MIRSLLILFVCCLLFAKANSQNTINSILDSISHNNKSLLANQKYWAARELEFKTGLYLYNPTVEYDYLKGSPVGAGNQNDFAITQSIDFPTSYSKRKQLSNERISQTEYEKISFRQDVLLKGKLSLLEMIFLNKQNASLLKRVGSLVNLQKDYSRKLEVGEANILDMNKVRIQLINLKNDLAMNESQRKQHLERLAELNGGKAVTINDSIFPLLPEVPKYEVMDSLIEANDPILKSVIQQKEISEKQVQLTRALSLPKMEAGYHYQSILGQRYQGLHLGFSIPLWQDANRVKQNKSELIHDEAQIESHLIEHLHEIKELYIRYENLKASYVEYQKLMKEVNTDQLLDKALRLGEISTIEYFLELTFFYATYDKYLELEKEYHQTVAELFKFQL